ncbi:hypothetical protein NH341_06470 [Tenacibaculum sp. XPcli2-G]|uniref:hypothetical protein n=1 Tax=Tenacibaculum sp. XPcli2-G TaxID=2954503 RepID=UPI002097D4AE|nr:hypothetical protein [Tenacibaculum sp. XPcli2-G]MCO7185062.1 hypothetical protein [Tenacibaculum sp. XPcli2-G]
MIVSNELQNEIILIESEIKSISLVDRIVFMISRLYKDFYEDVEKSSIRIINGIESRKVGSREEAESDFLENYGEEQLKTHVIGRLLDVDSGFLNPLLSQCSFNELKKLNHRSPRLISDKECFFISLFILPLDLLQRIVVYELTLVDEQELNLYVNRLKGFLSELAIRLGKPISWDLYNEIYRYELKQFPKEVLSVDPFEGEGTSLGFENGEHVREMMNFLEIPVSRQVLRFEDFENWLDQLNLSFIKQEVKQNKKYKERDKFKLNVSPLGYSKLLQAFFEKNGVQMSGEVERKINRFVLNSFEWKSKYPSISYVSEISSIDFLTKDITKKFVAFIILTMRLGYVQIEESGVKIKDILKDELQEINRQYIGLSDNLRNVIRNEFLSIPESKLIELVKFTGLDSFLEIKNYLKH